MRVQSQNDHRLRNRVVLFFFLRDVASKTTQILEIFPGSLKAQHIVFITLLKVFIHRLAHFPFHYVGEPPPLFTDSKFIFARASSVIAFLSGMSIIWIWIVTLCYCLIACVACACFLCVHSIPTHLFLYFAFVSALVSVCVAVCVSTYRKCGIG